MALMPFLLKMLLTRINVTDIIKELRSSFKNYVVWIVERLIRMS